MALQPVNLIYTTPDLPGPVMIEMYVAKREFDNPYAMRDRALIIAEVTVQTTLAERIARVHYDEDDDE